MNKPGVLPNQDMRRWRFLLRTVRARIGHAIATVVGATIHPNTSPLHFQFGTPFSNSNSRNKKIPELEKERVHAGSHCRSSEWIAKWPTIRGRTFHHTIIPSFAVPECGNFKPFGPNEACLEAYACEPRRPEHGLHSSANIEQMLHGIEGVRRVRNNIQSGRLSTARPHLQYRVVNRPRKAAPTSNDSKTCRKDVNIMEYARHSKINPRSSSKKTAAAAAAALHVNQKRVQ